MTEPFEEEQCGLLLGRGQRPAIELLVECCRETVHQITRLAAPAARFCFGHGEPVGKVDRFSLNGSSTPKDEDHPTSYENRPDQSYQEDTALRYDVRKSRPFLEIGKDIDGGENSHYFVHLPMTLAVLMPLVAGGAVFAWWRGWFDRRVWVIVLLLQAALAWSGFVAMNTGEAEEDRVEEIFDLFAGFAFPALIEAGTSRSTIDFGIWDLFVGVAFNTRPLF